MLFFILIDLMVTINFLLFLPLCSPPSLPLGYESEGSGIKNKLKYNKMEPFQPGWHLHTSPLDGGRGQVFVKAAMTNVAEILYL